MWWVGVLVRAHHPCHLYVKVYYTYTEVVIAIQHGIAPVCANELKGFSELYFISLDIFQPMARYQLLLAVVIFPLLPFGVSDVATSLAVFKCLLNAP